MTETLDPVTFEILRHRLWSINDEAATTIARVSGSPVANEAYDFNAALATASGEVVLIGAYVMAHAAALDQIFQYVMREYADNPGIGPGDMFATNDPYVGAMHQPDVVLVAPIFRGERLIAWCGCVVHQTDVGGPVAGSVTAGAASIYEEAIPLAPIRIVEGGRIRKDIEREYLIRSRMPGLNALDLRGQIAANNTQTERILALCEDYGTERVLAALDMLVDTTATRFRRRLAELPDGRWRHVTFVEHDGIADRVYPIRLTMTKRGGHLELDFSESADQAPSLINCPEGVLRGYSLAAVLTLLAYDMPWVPAALWRSITLRARSGSVVNARWPAGVSMGNTGVGHAVRTCVNICIAMMLDASERYADKVMASCIGSFAGQNISGHRESGARFGTMLLDSMAGGGGARSFADGANSSGFINAPASAIGNVETNEHNYPLLYLWRRESPDSGGPGRYRGGVGGEHGYIAHHVQGAIDCTLFAHGVEQPASSSVSGGEPGDTSGFLIARGGASLSARHVSDLPGNHETPPPKANTRINVADAFVHRYAGGGGYGDPLDRPPEEVLRDLEDGLVTQAGARRDYKVAVVPAGERWALDEAATAALRRAERRARLGGREPRRERGAHPAPGRRLGSGLVLDEGRSLVCCRRCGEALAPPDANVKDHLAVTELPVPQRWPSTAQHEGAARFVFRRFCCPACATQIETEVNLAGEPYVWSMEILN